jgi:hypothetical protein
MDYLKEFMKIEDYFKEFVMNIYMRTNKDTGGIPATYHELNILLEAELSKLQLSGRIYEGMFHWTDTTVLYFAYRVVKGGDMTRFEMNLDEERLLYIKNQREEKINDILNR